MQSDQGQQDDSSRNSDSLDSAGDAGGMTLTQLERLLSDLRFQPAWREDADVCDDYHDSHQLQMERLSRMEKLGIPPLITNLVAPVINSVLGLEVKSRTDWRVTEADEAQESPEELLMALNSKLNEAERQSRADSAISEAYASMVKTGVGWVEVSRNPDPFGDSRYRVRSVHRNEMYWDWRAKEPDLSDARYLIRKKRFDKDELIAHMPEHEELITWAMADRFKTWQTDTIDRLGNATLAMAANTERITDIDTTEWRDAERGRATVFEVWYRQWKRGSFVKLPDGTMELCDPNNIGQMIGASPDGQMQEMTEAAYAEIRCAFFLGCHRLYDFPSPYPHRHYPYIPFFGYREGRSGIRYGMIRAMISPQDVVNSADAKMHWLLSARRLTADSNAIDTKYNSWSQVQENLSSPNSVVLLDPDLPGSRYKVDSDFQLSDQQFKRRMQAAGDIEAVGGVYKAMLGKEGAATSGVAINSLVEQGTVMLSELNDNYSFGRRQVGELLFSLVREDLIGREVQVAIKHQGAKSVVTINKATVDEAGNEIKENDVSGVKIKVVLEDVPSTASFKAQQLQVMMEVIRSLPPEMQAVTVPSMIKLTDLPDKEEIADALKKMAGIGPKLSDEEQQAADQAAQQQMQQQQEQQARMLETQQKIADANLAFLETKVANLEKQNGKIDADRLVKMVEAMYSAMQAGQIVATVPNVAPIADEILKSAGFDDSEHVPAIDPSLQAGQPGQPIGANGVTNTQIQQAGPPSPAVGMDRGIETMRNDGAEPPVPMNQGVTPPAQA